MFSSPRLNSQLVVKYCYHTQKKSTMLSRRQKLKNWLKNTLPNQNFSISALAGDASFRRYYRLQFLAADQPSSCLVMDAPPPQENVGPFIHISGLLAAQGIVVPKILAQDETQGFLLLEDFGDKLLLNVLTATTVDTYYQQALDTLLTLQACPCPPTFQRFTTDIAPQEWANLQTWFLEKHLALKLSAAHKALFKDLENFIIQALDAQPPCFMHRDFQSRNLMLLSNGHLGVLDFQDASLGPCCYDVVSLLKDCYIVWPRQHVYGWLNYYYQAASKTAWMPNFSFEDFKQFFDLAGVQRHLKNCFIFARKYHRDNNPHYLTYLSQTLNYALEICEDYPALHNLGEFSQTHLLPALGKVSS